MYKPKLLNCPHVLVALPKELEELESRLDADVESTQAEGMPFIELHKWPTYHRPRPTYKTAGPTYNKHGAYYSIGMEHLQ